MSKAAVVAATQAAALEFSPRGIRVNAVCPGGVRTPLAVAVNGEALDKVMKILSPLGRIGRPEENAARKSVGQGKSVSVRVDLGGRRRIKKKSKNMIEYSHL